MATTNFRQIASEVFQEQISALQKIEQNLDSYFQPLIESILDCKGTIVLVGIGKSAHVANKIVATLNSTGSKAQFLHASEAIHGDLGLVQKDDAIIVLSKSGNTQEIKVILPFLKQNSSLLVAITSNPKSFLAEQADYILNVEIEKESEPNNLAPTTSTTAQLVMGDALAIALMTAREFRADDFAKFHPGGSLGKQLIWTVANVFNPNEKPQVNPEDSIKKVIESLSYSKNGITVLVENNKIVGVITDGDLRRILSQHSDYSKLKAKDIATFHPKTINENARAKEAFDLMNENKIGQLIVVDEKTNYVGVLDIYDILKEGIS